MFVRPGRAAIGFAILLTGCGHAKGDLRTVFGSDEAMAIVRSADNVTAYRLPSPSGEHESLADYEMVAGPVEVPSKTIQQLREALLNDAGYEWSAVKTCLPDFGVRLKFARGDDSVDVLLCFKCKMLAVYHNGTEVGGEDFDSIYQQLVAVTKSLFPRDPEIMALK